MSRDDFQPDFSENGGDIYTGEEYLPPPDRERVVSPTPTEERKPPVPPHNETINEEGVLIRTYFPSGDAQQNGAAPKPPRRRAEKTKPHVATVAVEPEPEQLVREMDQTTGRQGPGALAVIVRLGLILILCGMAAAVVILAASDRLPPQIADLFVVQGAAPAGEPGAGVTIPLTETPEPTPEESAEPTAVEADPTATRRPTATPEPEGETAALIYMPGGTFLMGAGSQVHEVTLSPYRIDRTEVTNAMWAACVEDGGCDEPGERTDFNGDPYYNDPDFAEHPVTFVTWDAANAYCEWRGGQLPTEAQWEMAARWDPITGQVSTFPWGDDAEPTFANTCDDSCPLVQVPPGYDDGFPQTAPVGSFPDGASAAGVLDMAGNVAEWVADWFAPYPSEPQENPTGPATGTLRLVRGGAWGVPLENVTSTARSRFAPDSQSAGLGLRCVMPVEQ